MQTVESRQGVLAAVKANLVAMKTTLTAAKEMLVVAKNLRIKWRQEQFAAAKIRGLDLLEHEILDIKGRGAPILGKE